LPYSALQEHLPRVEAQIKNLQKELTDMAVLKAEQIWRERGEIDADYLKHSISQRRRQRRIPHLIHPSTGDLCSSPEQMISAAETFYKDLYSPEPIDLRALNFMRSQIPEDLHLSSEDSQSICEPF
ncbi:hypothetical protein BCV72DRAFT_189998, partial [Rhizopus microsporus var. microsporus]